MNILFDTTTFETEDHYDFESSHFDAMIQELIGAYEKRYRTKVIYIAIAGKIELWDKIVEGGQVISPSRSIFSVFANGNYEVTVKVDEETKEFIILAHHHDGTHIFGLEFLTPNKVKTQFPTLHATSELTGDEAEKLASINRNRVKYNDLCVGYYGKLESEER